jgi:hypothetical protein
MGLGSVFKAITSIAKNPKILSFFQNPIVQLVTTLAIAWIFRPYLTLEIVTKIILKKEYY